MFKFIIEIVVVIVLAFGGWIAGSMYPAPPELLSRLHAQALADRVQADLAGVDLEALRGRMGEERFEVLSQRASRIAAAAGNALVVERADTNELNEVQAAAMSMPTVAPAPARARTGAFESALALCPRMTVSNAPAANATTGQVTGYTPVVNVNGVRLAVNPTRDACLSSSFGQRGSSRHKGVDYHNPLGGDVMAAGDGVIVEMKYRDDYGNMLLIDHGSGVYTRYAHLSNFRSGLRVGQRVTAGDVIGLMGNTASYRIPVHLHYELLLGDYNTPRQSFGLTPHSPFEYRA